MANRINPVSKVGKIRKIKLKLHRHRTMKGLYFNNMYSRIYKKNDIKKFEKKIKPKKIIMIQKNEPLNVSS
ncbi:hypothetical protein [Clostridium sp. BL-8]|uniref:hypothetical protein n=1 Tax=Clostridium sp. BL-8 TaxID=349938 RepID=UPI00098C9150|nr:hypothetical protein [Clostridium sp. BL-8]OOM67900.1 hypothetical protein CLOBL_54060 [Clostridium sp. BL-8]